MSFELKALVDKLNPTCRKALEAAAELCVSQTNYNVEIEHFLMKLLDHPDTDIQRLLRYYEVTTANVTRDLIRAMDTFKRGNSRTPALSPHILRLLEEAWKLSSLYLDDNTTRSGALLLALVDHDPLRGMIVESCKALQRVPRKSIRQEIREIVRGSSEDTAPAPSSTQPDAPRPAAATGATSALDQFTIDLTARAKAGLIDQIQGRDVEVRQIIDVFLGRARNA